MALFIFAKALFYVVLVLHIFNWGLFLKRVHEKLRAVHTTYMKYVFVLQATCTFAVCHWFGSTVKMEAAHYFALAVLALLLWDFGVVFGPTPKDWFFLNLHHLGAFFALLYQVGEISTRSWRNTTFFSWMWGSHAFIIVQDVLCWLRRTERRKGDKLLFLSVLRHIYAVCTCYFLYQYLNDVDQPGVGWNYQTLACFAMTTGRMLTGDNYKNVDWLRRIELPGYLIIVLDHVLFHDIRLQRAISIVLSLFLCHFTYLLMFKKAMRKPDKWFGPDVNNEMKLFLQNVAENLPQKDPNPQPHVLSWFDNNEGWKEAWPLHRAIVSDDFGEAERLLAKTETECCSPNAKMTVWHDSQPLGWAVHFERTALVLLLLQHGANPYCVDKRGCDAVGLAMTKKSLKSIFEEINAVALKFSPSVSWYDKSIMDRAKILLSRI
eukprot:TRINITY_DN11236_c0_g1_i7.p1 TRINITY_DN11236_c0_g1~~TRINITY_DN11236_c0_g1_i7.p1  ORF type:complete len:434 (+),score=63.44 TRINITY_DN11236_c0_g1_i7:116-1417(+)